MIKLGETLGDLPHQPVVIITLRLRESLEDFPLRINDLPLRVHLCSRGSVVIGVVIRPMLLDLSLAVAVGLPDISSVADVS